MTDVEREQAATFATKIRDINQMSLVGCSDVEIRAMTTWLRDIDERQGRPHGTYDRLWHSLGLPDYPTVNAYSLVRSELGEGYSVICFGDAEEVPTSVAENEQFLKLLGVKLKAGDFVLQGSIAQSWSMWGNGPVPVLGNRPPLPFEKRVMSIDEFFNGIVARVNGIEMSRKDVVEYGCYGLGITHTDSSRYLAKNKEKKETFDQIKAQPPYFKRDNVLYMLLSIARDITLSIDAARFVEAVQAR